MRAAVGEEAEDLVVRYTKLPWTAETVGTLADTAASRDDGDRRVLLMRLANEVDDHEDLGLLHVAEAEHRREFIRTALHRCVAMAEQLGYPALAIELARVLKETLTSDVPWILPMPSIRPACDTTCTATPASSSALT